MRCSVGNINAAVLPVPVCADATTSLPARTAGIAAACTGKDVVASAHTGTGKTAAFMLPTLQRIAVEKPGGTEKLDTIGELVRFIESRQAEA